MSTDQITLPPIGLGTWSLRGAAGAGQIRTAVDSGYRLLDTAYNYENEGAVGAAITSSGVDRDELLITSKLPGRYHGHDDALTAIEESLFRLGLEHLDLYLIHWPNPRQGKFVEAWHALIEAQEKGLVRHIGVSNFLPEHIAELREQTGVTPVVNQLELHPLFPQTEVLQWHREHGITVEAWSPLGRGSLLEDPVITETARAEDMSPGELMLAWHAAIGTVPLPRSASPQRQKLNLAAVGKRISRESVAAVTAIGDDGRRLKNQDPAEYEEF
ncbi:aldo/keto reductase [Corynebacterium halotolerans]|uniref:aldo/keto reductase n=1 Tax=Corynebacterium halotolerans TaxID=225326 RepID=UPI003CFB2E6F